MFREHKKELLLSIVLVTVLFLAADFLGDFLVSVPDDLTISAEIMFLGLAVLILPALLGTIPSGFFIGKKTGDVKAAIFVPAVGAAIGGALVLLLSGIPLLLMTDAAWQSQLNEMEDLGITFFANMTLAEFKSMVLFSTAFGAVFLAIINFAIGLAGGFLGRVAAPKK